MEGLSGGKETKEEKIGKAMGCEFCGGGVDRIFMHIDRRGKNGRREGLNVQVSVCLNIKCPLSERTAAMEQAMKAYKERQKNREWE